MIFKPIISSRSKVLNPANQFLRIKNILFFYFKNSDNFLFWFCIRNSQATFTYSQRNHNCNNQCSKLKRWISQCELYIPIFKLSLQQSTTPVAGVYTKKMKSPLNFSFAPNNNIRVDPWVQSVVNSCGVINSVNIGRSFNMLPNT